MATVVHMLMVLREERPLAVIGRDCGNYARCIEMVEGHSTVVGGLGPAFGLYVFNFWDDYYSSVGAVLSRKF